VRIRVVVEGVIERHAGRNGADVENNQTKNHAQNGTGRSFDHLVLPVHGNLLNDFGASSKHGFPSQSDPRLSAPPAALLDLLFIATDTERVAADSGASAEAIVPPDLLLQFPINFWTVSMPGFTNRLLHFDRGSVVFGDDVILFVLAIFVFLHKLIPLRHAE
jgi:hypothetical protein